MYYSHEYLESYIFDTLWFFKIGIKILVAEPEGYPKDIDLEKYDVIRYPVLKMNTGK